MIDLDELAKPVDKLYCWFGVALINRKINYAEWRILTNGLFLFTYIIPSERKIDPNLVDIVYSNYKCDDLSFLTAAGMMLRNIEAHYTELEQLAMLEIMESPGRIARLP